jgi:hypothetical protein
LYQLTELCLQTFLSYYLMILHQGECTSSARKNELRTKRFTRAT